MDIELIYKEESYQIIGICIEVHKILGKGLSEAVYADAIEYELLTHNIPFKRECPYKIEYKDIILPHYYYADFVIDEKIILEVKAIESLTKSHSKQIINYLSASKLRLGLLVNFGEDMLNTKRIIR
ncbi:MAG: GxxExxY protein [Bacteroidetes bacterium]|nr:GxxExxY protein [Bacteroidota bacterium]MBU1719386.1 GxxExxY protein [Bacteroidota bacterium]